MKGSGNTGSRSGMTSGLLLAGAVSLLALPSAVLAFSTSFDANPESSASNQPMDSLNSDAPPAQLARSIPLRSLAKGKLYPFTPANTPTRPDRSVTVAVRMDAQVIQAIGAKGSHPGESGNAPLRIAPTAFNLGVSRGYQVRCADQRSLASSSCTSSSTPPMRSPASGCSPRRASSSCCMKQTVMRT